MLLKSQNNKTAIILAGGLSRRMGFSKEKIKIGNKYIVHNQIDILHDLFDEIIVVSNNELLYTDKDVIVVKDIIDKKSPLVGLHAGLTHSSNDINYLIACDMPNIDKEFINHMFENFIDQEALVTIQNGFFEPFNALYSKRILGKLEHFIEHNLKFQTFIKTLNCGTISDTNAFKDNMFHNLNTQQDLNKELQDPKTFEEFEVTKYLDDKEFIYTDYVIKEFPITLYINKEKYVTLLITPTNIKELVVGYMKSEKIITNYSDIEEIIIDEVDFKVDIELFNKDSIQSSNKDKLLTSGCGVGTRFHEDIDSILLDSIETDAMITYDEILNASIELNNKSGLFKLTGGVHSCLYFYDNNNAYFEDIGRHNAVDKVVGFIELSNIQTKKSYLISSGRVSSDMLIKCSISKIPIVLSRSAPTSLAVSLAEKLGITLIGFVRGNKFNVYTSKYRVMR